MKKVFRVKDLCCANCASKIERTIAKLDGVTRCNLAFMTTRLTIEFDDNRQDEILTSVKKIVAKIEPECSLIEA